MNEIRKENDMFTTTLFNPESTTKDLIGNGLNTSNTQLLTPEQYKETPLVKKYFTDENGVFNEPLFNQVYAEAYKKSRAHSNYDASTARGTCCCHFSKFVISTALGGKKAPNVLTLAQNNNIKAAEKYGFTTMELTTNSEIKPGDIISYVKKAGGGHVVIAIGNGKIAEAGHSGIWPHISKLNVKKICDKSKRAFIVRPK